MAQYVQLKDSDTGEFLYPIPFVINADNMDLLWENTSLSSEFPAQSITKDLDNNTLDLTQYDDIEIEFMYGTSNYNKTRITTNRFASAHDFGGWTSTGGLAGINRYITINTNDVTFSDAVAKTLTSTNAGTVDNTKMIPYRIYGIKSTSSTVGPTVPIKHGGTDATTAEQALANLGGVDKNKIVDLTSIITYTSTETLTKVATINIPANCMASITTRSSWSYGQPLAILLKTTSGKMLAATINDGKVNGTVNVELASPTASVNIMTTQVTNIDVYTQHSSVSSGVNGLYVEGFYIQL